VPDHGLSPLVMAGGPAEQLEALGPRRRRSGDQYGRDLLEVVDQLVAARGLRADDEVRLRLRDQLEIVGLDTPVAQ
jgi:hypothetical protein